MPDGHSWEMEQTSNIVNDSRYRLGSSGLARYENYEYSVQPIYKAAINLEIFHASTSHAAPQRLARREFGRNWS